MAPRRKPLVVITGAAGRIGTQLIERLIGDYRIVGLDVKTTDRPAPIVACDLTSDQSVAAALGAIKKTHGATVAAVVHLAAYFDFTGEDNPLYQTVNIEGTERLLKHLAVLDVERFVYSSTMLVHAPSKPGELTTEETPIEPGWAYPKSKAGAEAIIARKAKVPYVILRFAGVYDTEVQVPTLAEQIARIYERDLESNLYAGDLNAGQSLLHSDDMADAVAAAIARRDTLPKDAAILVGEPGAVAYQALQQELGVLIHGETGWATLPLPKSLAKVGAMLQHAAEPLVPDSIDQGERPFIRPFMVDLASDRYALDTTRARELLGWAPRHRIEEELPSIVEHLKADPAAWYKANKITPPHWMTEAIDKGREPEDVRSRHERSVKRQHTDWLWAHWANIGLGAWLIASPATLGYPEATMVWSDIVSGVLLLVFGYLSLDWRLSLARFAAGAVGIWLLFAPLIFWTTSPAAYLSGTLVGSLAIAFATLSRPFPLVSPIATETGPDVPPGWNNSPSTFSQRLPIIALALVGFLISRYMAAYQLGHIDGVWEPFFPGSLDDPKNGTEEIITSEVSEAWPVPDAGLGAAVYVIEVLTGLIGSARRWRTIPWLVILFGLMIVPLGIVSITFIIIQPIVLGTWCTLCLIAAAAMVIQIPFSLDELVATGQFLKRKHKEKSLVRAFIFGDTDEGTARDRDDFGEPLSDWLRRGLGGVNMPWTLALSVVIGIWLMLTRVTIGAEGAIANSDHLIGALVIVIAVTAMAEVGRPMRLLNAVLGAALVIMPFVLGAGLLPMVNGVVLGIALIALSLPRGRLSGRYGGWNRYMI